MADGLILGRPLWYELLTTDTKGAEAFYRDVVGWTTAPFEGAPQPYDILNRPDGSPVDGVMRIPDGMNFPPHWVMYVGVPELEDAVTHVERLGGRALSRVIDVPDVGRMRTMLDAQGAMFSVYEPAEPPDAPEAEAQVGDIAWHELHTTDAEASMKFYTELFGWRPTGTMDMGPMGKYHMFGRSFPLGGMMNKPAAMPGPPHWMLYFHVPDVQEAAARVTAKGGRVLNGPLQVPGGGWIVNAMDPQGAAFSLHHYKQA